MSREVHEGAQDEGAESATPHQCHTTARVPQLRKRATPPLNRRLKQLLAPLRSPVAIYSPDVGNDGEIRESKEILGRHDVAVAGGGDNNVGLGGSLLHGGDLVARHGSLEGVDGVDLGNDDTGAVRAERLGALLTCISDVS